MTAPSRRQLLLSGAALAVGAAAAETTRAVLDSPASPASVTSPAATHPTGTTQAGVDRPIPPLAHLHLHALTAPRSARTRAVLGAALAALGQRILDLVASAQSTEPTGDLTIQVGIGADLLDLAQLDPAPDVRLPDFAGSSDIPDPRRGGDLFLQVAADRPELVTASVDTLLAALPGFAPRWSQAGYRPVGDGAVTRNPFGYEDGIVQPDTADGVPEHVWLGDGPVAGATVGVVRRFTLDTAAFHQLPESDQDGVFGRQRASSQPLSGGAPRADVNLGAKSPDGAYLIPADAHVRAAHPSFTDSTVMLRRGYGFRETVDGTTERAGLLFISYQDELSVFTRTQLRMDRMDRLMDFATPTAEAGFLVLPGFDADRPLGSTLFG